MENYLILEFAGGRFELNIKRDDVVKMIFNVLATYVDSGDTPYQYDINKCFINFQQEDKEAIKNIINFHEQEYIPNARFAICEYKEKKILIVVGEHTLEINDGVLINIEIDLAIFIYSVYTLGARVNYAKTPIEVYNDLLCQPEDEAYHGHCLDDLKEFFENIAIYELVEDNSLIDNDVYAVYAYYLLKTTFEEPNRWNNETLNVIEGILLSGNDKIPFHNIVLALLASQWNHTFLESYRCIEHLFHVIKLEPFYEKLNTSLSLIDVSKEIEDIIAWKPNEEGALQDIFKEIEGLGITVELEQVKNKYNKGMRIEKWYYKQRNSIAHYRAIHEPLKFSDNEWNVLICFNFFVIEYLYEKYKDKI